MREVITNVDVDALAKSAVVRAFMLRILDEERDALTGAVFVVTLAKRAADAFDLYYADSTDYALALLDVAAHVLALDSACARARR